MGKRKRTAKENQDCGFEWNLFNFSLILVCWRKAHEVVCMWTHFEGGFGLFTLWVRVGTAIRQSGLV